MKRKMPSWLIAITWLSTSLPLQADPITIYYRLYNRTSSTVYASCQARDSQTLIYPETSVVPPDGFYSICKAVINNPQSDVQSFNIVTYIDGLGGTSYSLTWFRRLAYGTSKPYQQDVLTENIPAGWQVSMTCQDGNDSGKINCTTTNKRKPAYVNSSNRTQTVITTLTKNSDSDNVAQ